MNKIKNVLVTPVAVFAILAFACLAGCGADDGQPFGGDATGGAGDAGGTGGAGGSAAVVTGGAGGHLAGTGGVAVGTGGAAAGTGGLVGTGGSVGTGGAVGTDGSVGTGGVVGAGGAGGAGGLVGSGGAGCTGLDRINTLPPYDSTNPSWVTLQRALATCGLTGVDGDGITVGAVTRVTSPCASNGGYCAGTVTSLDGSQTISDATGACFKVGPIGSPAITPSNGSVCCMGCWDGKQCHYWDNKNCGARPFVGIPNLCSNWSTGVANTCQTGVTSCHLLSGDLFLCTP